MSERDFGRKVSIGTENLGIRIREEFLGVILIILGEHFLVARSLN